MKYNRKILCLASMALLFGSTSLLAAEKSAISVIKNAYAYLGAMDTYAFDAIIIDEEAQNGEIINKVRHDINVKLDRPGNLKVDVNGDYRDRTNYIHNGKYTMVDHDFGYYGQIDTPKTIDGALDYIFKKFDISAPLSALIYSNMSKRMKFKSSKYFGTMDVAGVTCDYVAFKNRIREVHVWIAKGDKPLVKAYSIIDTATKGNPRINTSLTWHTDAEISNSDFVFIAPKGVTKISVEPAY